VASWHLDSQETHAACLELRFVKVDSDAAPRSSTRLQIRSIPTTLLFVGGREAARQSGAMTAAQLAAWVDAALR
jgi:thioredoxin 2